MFWIAVCDDDEKMCRGIEDMLSRFLETISTETSLEVFFSGAELNRAINDGRFFDLIFLDIGLPDESGISVAKTIRNVRKDELTQIVFISANTQYAMELFDLRPMNFLVKPLVGDKMVAMIQKAMEIKTQQSVCFKFSAGGISHRIPYGNILYFSSSGKKTKVVAVGGSCEFYGKLSDLTEEAEQQGFFMIHKSFLVNRIYVARYEYRQLQLTTGEILSISQPHRTGARAWWFKRGKG